MVKPARRRSNRANLLPLAKRYGGMRVDQVRCLKELKKENTRLKRLVTDLFLDNAILKEAARGKC